MENRFRIREWWVQPQLNALESAEAQVQIEPRAMQVLVFLSEHAGQVVSKEQLIESVWEGAFVTDEALTYAIWELRKAMGDDARRPRFIQTIPKKGYRLIAPVRWEKAELCLSDRQTATSELEEVPDGGEPRAEAPVVIERPERSWVTLAWVAAGLTAVCVGVAGWLSFFPSRLRGPPLRTMPLTSYEGFEEFPALSPDGNQVAFVWSRGEADYFHLYVKMVGGGVPLQLTNMRADDCCPAWSADRSQIAFLREAKGGHEVRLISALGGPERLMAHVAGSAYGLGLDWSPDGHLLAIVDKEKPEDPDGIFLYTIETGEKQRLTEPPANTVVGDGQPRFSPDGQTLAFVRTMGVGQSDIYLVSTSLGEPRRLTFGNHNTEGLDWTFDGASIVFSSSRVGRAGTFGLWSISVSGGESEPLAVGEQGYSPTLSRDGGRLSYAKSGLVWNIWQIAGPTEPEGERSSTRLISSTWVDWFPQYSPDGHKILFASNRSGHSEIWICDGDGSNKRQLTFLESPMTGRGAWSPDGSQIAFHSSKEGNYELYVVSAKGGPPRRLTASSWIESGPSWSRDGRWIYFHSNRSGRREVWKVPAGGGEATQITTHGGTEALESPEGQFIYFTKRYPPDSGPAGVWRIPVDGGQEVQVLEHGAKGEWAVFEQGICYLNRDSAPGPTIEVFDFATRRVRPVAVLVKPPTPWGFSVSPDGRWILYVQDESDSDIMLVENFH